jgi:ATP-dependent RNA/DNA helicase IGHMBP2
MENVHLCIMIDAISELGELAKVLKIEQQEDFKLHDIYLNQRSVKERRDAGITWFPLKVIESGYGLGAYPFLVVENPGEKKRHQFQSASPVALFSAHPEHDGESIKGTIGYVDDSRMKITFHLDELPDWVDDGKIGVNLLFDSKTYDEMFKALNVLINTEKGRLRELRDKLLGFEPIRFYASPQEKTEGLNASQQEAKQAMIDAEDVCIIHGPPGTGKTTTLIEGIQHLCKEEKQVLVCAPSNAAVDHLTRCAAAKGLRVVRIGNLAKIEEDASAFTIDAVLQRDKSFKQIKELKKKATELRKLGGKYKRSFGREEAEQRKLIFKEAKELNKEARELEDFLVQKTLDNAQVITATLIGSTHDYLANRKFSVVVIDEAGQCIEPAAWVPILRAEKVIMAGDPFQLPPTVKSYEAERKGLSISLMEKAIQRLERVQLLSVQYRMNEDIMSFSNQQFYKSALEAHESVKHRSLGDAISTIEFVDTAGCGYAESSGEKGDSLMNVEEVALVKRHLESWYSSELLASIAVISPYRAQVDLLEAEFGEWPNVAVNTIDSFQGQERDIVYISLVRSNEKSEIGFLKDYRRMNVAMTRAKKKLVIVGDSSTLGNDVFYSALIDHFEKRGAYHSAWEWMA